MNLKRAPIIRRLKEAAEKEKHEVKRVAVRGESKELTVIRMEVKDLLYNPRLGRLILDPDIATRTPDEESDRDPDDLKLQREIESKILKLPETKELLSHIREEGQLEHGIVSYDGVLINGNRRLAVLRRLTEETKKDKYRFMTVAVLPEETSPSDMYLLEISLQMTPETRARYGPITTMVHLRRGIEQHKLDKVRVAHAMYLDPDEVDLYLERLQLIDEYLQFIKKAGRYDLIEGGPGVGKNEHFTTMQDIKRKHGKQPYWEGLQYHIFQLIRSGEIYHEIRKIRRWQATDVGEFAKLVAVGETPKPKAGGDAAIDILVDNLRSISETVSGAAAAAAELIPIPKGPTRPDPDQSANRVEPSSDPELKRTVEAVAAVNEAIQNRDDEKRPIDLLKQALRKLEAVELRSGLWARGDAKEGVEARSLLEGIIRQATSLRDRLDRGEQTPKASTPRKKKGPATKKKGS